MAEISTVIVYDTSNLVLIGRKRTDVNFSHTCWGDDDLEVLRSTIRSFYREAQRGYCAYCRNPVSLRDGMNCHVEHIAPKSKYPQFLFEPKNFCVICSDCNTIKRNQEVLNDVPNTVNKGSVRRRYPRSSGAFLIVHPHFDKWDDHIQVFGKYYVDKTTKGHFTIGACVLNRHLRKFGWEPAVIEDSELSNAMSTYLDNDDPVIKSSAVLRLMRILQQL